MNMNEIATTGNTLELIGQQANRAIGKYVFSNYQDRKAHNTTRGQKAALVTFCDYLAGFGVEGDADALYSDPSEWKGVSFALVAGFGQWMLGQGYAIATINNKLAHVRTYCELAAQAQIVPADELALIRGVRGFSGREARNIDSTRTKAGLDTRRSSKKADPTPLTRSQADSLLVQPDTPQGRRDSLMMALFLEHGLRVSEVEALRSDAVDGDQLSFYRKKTDTHQVHQLTPRSGTIATAYLEKDGAAHDGLIRGSRRGGTLTNQGMKARAIRRRVGVLGERIGVTGLSPHDLRHAWATFATRAGTGVKQLQDAGGWNSPAMPLRYAKSAEIANTGVQLR